jgi:hypothetical protein
MVTSQQQTDNDAGYDSKPEKKRSWAPIVDKAIERINYLNNVEGIIPTLRTIHYYLMSVGLTNGSKSDYAALSRRLVDARLDGRLSWYALADNSRKTVNIPRGYQSPEDYVQWGADYLRNAHRTFTLPRWRNQPHYVEFWVEKDAMVGTVLSIVKDRAVAVAINKGNDGWTHFYESIARIRDKVYNEGRLVHIYFLTDYDPSGQGMIRDLLNRFDKLYVDIRSGDIEFVPLAITTDQIRKLNLPEKNDEKTLTRLKRDSKCHAFMAENAGRLFAVELDALPAYAPEYFKRLLLSSIDKHFDKKIYEQTLIQQDKDRKKIARLANNMLLRTSQHRGRGGQAR